MRIAHVIDYFHTDVGYQEYYLALHQGRGGHDVDVITSRGRHHTVAVATEDEAAGELALEQAGVRVHRLDSKSLGHDRELLRGLTRTLDRVRPEVIHCHGPFAPTTVRTVRWARRTGTALLVDNHIQETGAPGASTLMGQAFYTAFRTGFRRTFRRTVGCWIADGPEKADFLASRLGIPRSEIELVPLGFDPEIFRFDPGVRRAARRARAWTEEDLVIVVTGKLHEGKRVDLVARAADRMAEQGSVRLVLAATMDESYERSVVAAAPRLAAAGRLDRMGMQRTRALAELYLAADIAAFARLPSISIFEAAGTGAAVALGDDPFARWLTQLHDGITANDPRELDRGFSVDVDDASRARRASDAAQVFGWPSVSEAFVDYYRGLQ